MELTLRSRKRQIQQHIEQDLYWYDQVNQVMLHGRGGRMEFIYVPAQKRMMPKIVNHSELVWGNDYPSIQEWVMQNKDKYGMEVEIDTGRDITVTLDAKHLDDVATDLFSHSITFDYDDVQAKKEMRARYG